MRGRAASAVLLLTFLSTSGRAQDRADHIYINGKIWTGEDSLRQVQALAVVGARIVAVGVSRPLAGSAPSSGAWRRLSPERVFPATPQIACKHFPDCRTLWDS